MSTLANLHYYPRPLIAPKTISHFSDQLARQQDWLSQLARDRAPTPFVAEMFLQLAKPGGGGTPYDNPALFDQRGSTFLWHREARVRINPPLLTAPQFRPTRNWSSSGGALIASAMTATPGRTIDLLLGDVIACWQGDHVPGCWERRPRALARLSRGRSVLLLRGMAPSEWQDGRRG